MDNRWTKSRQETGARDRRQFRKEQTYQDSLIEDMAEDFRLPINQRPTENVDLDNVEQASLDTQLTSSNIGFKLLQKMGWKGKGLGKNEQGIIEPIKSGMRDPRLGVGKQEEDDFFTAEENIQRRKLDVELEETEENARKREDGHVIGNHQLWKVLRISCSFYYLVASSACFVHIMKIQVLAEREQKIQTEVKEIRKVFYCDLCNKQYKLAMEFEAHLSSYDHNHRKRFKEMKEMHGSSSRDDRQKREQQRQEREMAKFAQIADAQKQQQIQQQQEETGTALASSESRSATALADQEQRKTLKFGFSSKGGASKNTFGGSAKKQKVAVSSVFGNDTDEE
ncbi:G patch domain-containing protein 8 [Senna tora]|uniref:G patch domain-containing protein 8 n=1 Tax=Senna tora TaxID=362788 RepID=A0A834SK06_9FABA|nr:G patch domain-containing protein 8 [Senna tora]